MLDAQLSFAWMVQGQALLKSFHLKEGTSRSLMKSQSRAQKYGRTVGWARGWGKEGRGVGTRIYSRLVAAPYATLQELMELVRHFAEDCGGWSITIFRTIHRYDVFFIDVALEIKYKRSKRIGRRNVTFDALISLMKKSSSKSCTMEYDGRLYTATTGNFTNIRPSTTYESNQVCWNINMCRY